MKLGQTYFSGSITFDEGNNFIGPDSSILTGSFTGSVAGTFEGDFTGASTTAISGAFTDVSASIASERLLNTTDTLTGDLTVTGEVIAQTLHVQQVTSSIVYSSGSNVFGENVSDTQTFTGSLQVSGSTNYLLGNVGIGTTSPDYKLEVESTSDADLVSIKSTAIANSTQMRLGISGSASVISGTGGSSGNLVLKTYGSERMRIDTSGNVGIGTPSPNSLLHLLGNSAAIRIEESGGAQVRMAAGGSTGYLGTYTNHSLQFLIDANTAVYIDTNRNVAIGATPPTSTLHIENSDSEAILTIEKDTVTAGTTVGTLRFVNSGATNTYASISGGRNSSGDGLLTLKGGGSNAVFVNENGSLGIGNDSPSDKLSIKNTSGDAGILLEGSSQTMRIDQNSIRTSTTSPINIFTNNTSGANSLYVSNDGRFGVGTTSPTSGTKLDVNGKIRAVGDIIMAQTNPRIDYDGGSSGALRFFSTSANLERMRIDSSGNASIGDGGNGARNSRLLLQNAGSQGAPQLMLIDSDDSGKQFEMRYNSGIMIFDHWNGSSRQEQMRLNSDNELSINTTGANATLNIGQTGTQRLKAEFGNSNSQGTAQRFTIVRHYPVVSSGNQLIIPFVSQGNLNSTTLIKIMGHAALWNSSDPRAFTATIAVGHLQQLYSLSTLESTGNVSSVTSSGMNVIINFTTAYTSGTANGIYVTLEYMTNVISYSIDAGNIAMN